MLKGMYRSVILFLILTLNVFCFFRSTTTHAGWTGISPNGGYVRCMAVSPKTPNTLYAGTCYDGVYMSTNGGTSWTDANTGLPPSSAYIYSLAINPETPNSVYAGTNGGVYKSATGGSAAAYSPYDSTNDQGDFEVNEF
jgi:hypothetical protein